MTTQPEMPFPDPTGRRGRTRRVTRGESPHRQKIMSPRDGVSVNPDYFECPRCAARFDTLPDFDNHRKAER